MKFIFKHMTYVNIKYFHKGISQLKRRLLREINSLKGPIDALKYFGGVNLTGLGVCNNGNHPTMCTSTSLSYQQSFPTFLQFGIVFVSFFFCCMCHCYQVSTGFILSAISNPNPLHRCFNLVKVSFLFGVLS